MVCDCLWFREVRLVGLMIWCWSNWSYFWLYTVVFKNCVFCLLAIEPWWDLSVWWVMRLWSSSMQIIIQLIRLVIIKEYEHLTVVTNFLRLFYDCSVFLAFSVVCDDLTCLLIIAQSLWQYFIRQNYIDFRSLFLLDSCSFGFPWKLLFSPRWEKWDISHLFCPCKKLWNCHAIISCILVMCFTVYHSAPSTTLHEWLDIRCVTSLWVWSHVEEVFFKEVMLLFDFVLIPSWSEANFAIASGVYSRVFHFSWFGSSLILFEWDCVLDLKVLTLSKPLLWANFGILAVN